MKEELLSLILVSYDFLHVAHPIIYWVAWKMLHAFYFNCVPIYFSLGCRFHTWLLLIVGQDLLTQSVLSPVLSGDEILVGCNISSSNDFNCYRSFSKIKKNH